MKNGNVLLEIGTGSKALDGIMDKYKIEKKR